MNIINRRSALRGLAAISTAAGAGSAFAMLDTPDPATAPQIAPAALPAGETTAFRIKRLAEELSHLLADYDGGQWEIICRPIVDGNPNVALQPMAISPLVRLHQAFAIIQSAVPQLAPPDAEWWMLSARGGEAQRKPSLYLEAWVPERDGAMGNQVGLFVPVKVLEIGG